MKRKPVIDIVESWEEKYPSYVVGEQHQKDYKNLGTHSPYRIALDSYKLRAYDYRDLSEQAKCASTFWQDVVDIFEGRVSANIYSQEGIVRNGLNDLCRQILLAGVPDYFRDKQYKANYPIWGIDTIPADIFSGICEFEPTILGAGLSAVSNKARAKAGQAIFTHVGRFRRHFRSVLPRGGVMIVSAKHVQSLGQLRFLIDHVFPKGWRIEILREDFFSNPRWNKARIYYRVFDPGEYENDELVKRFIEGVDAERIVPSLTPWFEGKNLLTIAHDKRFYRFFAERHGRGFVAYLRATIPQSWIVGQEQFFDSGLPLPDTVSSMDLVRLYGCECFMKPNATRWGTGITYFEELKNDSKRERRIEKALLSGEQYVCQRAIKGGEREIEYYTPDTPDGSASMIARYRVRLYFSSKGKILSNQVTARNARIVHVATDACLSVLSSFIQPFSVHMRKKR